MLSLLSAVLLAQCATGINDNAQNLCGTKTFPNGVVIGQNGGDYEGAVVRGSGVLLDGPYSYVGTTGGRALILRGSVSSGSSPSFVLDTYGYARTASEEILRVYNGNTPIFVLYADGRIVTGVVETVGHSGDPSLFSRNNYVSVAAGFPPHYQGEHGALSVSPGAACENEAFNLFQLSSAKSGTGARTDYAFNVTCRGGVYSRDPPNSYELPRCNDALPEPPEPNNRYGNCTNLVSGGLQGNFGLYGPQTDGGYCYDWTTYYGPDGGYAKNGTVFGFVADVGEGCQCVVTKYDGGASPAGWFKLSDRSECRPSP